MDNTTFIPEIKPIEKMLDRIGAEAVFGKATSENGVTIIPVAQIAYGFGYGGGYGHDAGETSTAEQRATEEGSSEGGGTGGGAGGRATPTGYIQISADGVKYQPIVDETRIPIADIVMAAWSIFWVAATIRTIAKAIAQTRQAKIKANKG